MFMNLPNFQKLIERKETPEIPKIPEIPEITPEAPEEQKQQIKEIPQKEKLKQRPIYIPQKSEVLISIENILAEDLYDTYQSMPYDLKIKFKTEGEKISQKIENLILNTKISFKKLVRKILKLLKKWLSMIPNATRYFIEQEAKIKLDKLLKLRYKLLYH